MEWKKFAFVIVPALALALGVFAVLNRLVEPLPPRRVTFSGGRENGAYHTFAKEYARLAAADGFTVDILTGAGSVETLKRLASGQAMAGFVQGGTAEAAPTDGLLSLGSLYYEPVWLFHRRTPPLPGLPHLPGPPNPGREGGSGLPPPAVRLPPARGVHPPDTTPPPL